MKAPKSALVASIDAMNRMRVQFTICECGGHMGGKQSAPKHHVDCPRLDPKSLWLDAGGDMVFAIPCPDPPGYIKTDDSFEGRIGTPFHIVDRTTSAKKNG